MDNLILKTVNFLFVPEAVNRPPKVRPKNLILGGRFFNGKIQF